ncbi:MULTISPECIES: zinc-dependent peptidase [Comamonas]|jgi:Mlc titration factor MtfA (ptsG expression regulator)|uniref:Zinc-dependent peptidase n=1 Tax=Comamonas terrigena TaxID=32013 RepID=A0A2A7UTV6_COMTR|nr:MULTISPECIES: M90 family metallopeptidase [Comamonas]MBV7420935.1 zinc-dependent peptidase [Comamonas sp. CMM03]MDH0051171.1 zinc-dependent peptidase [Comamonas terrigena]MDH0513622.1 zinc-dependent peptidase [Comamonas terrigena]MDH1093176.1 zinc-dependent peptidase [Comamonas terrigena]MDH1293602.1 zinc-dependent peptidase [Comamonas terrigena]
MDWQRVLPTWARRAAVRAGALPPAPVPAALWQATVATYPFLERLTPAEDAHLQQLVAHFLQRKEFSGAHGLVITDAMAVAIAAQACVLLLYFGEPADALRWYDDFVGIVVHADDVVARRKVVDEAGVVHHYREELMGEAMEGGPVMLSWAAVQPGHAAHGGHTNVVIHEFAHKLDMHDGHANGCPPLPRGFMGHTSASAARQAWSAVWGDAYERFRDLVIRHERFGQPAPWLDAYGAEAPAEFFAVACEGYWVDRERMAEELPTVVHALDAFFGRLAR